MKASIIIRAYNEEKHIGRLLYGISQQTYKNVETILIDSGSTDATLEIAAQYPVKVVHITPEEFTFGRSLNRGIAASSGDVLVITSAHCYPVYPDWLEQLIKPLEQADVALCYGRQSGGDTNHFSEHQFFSKYFPANSVLQQAHPYSHNANAAVRRTLWEQNHYNENLTGLEDLAWSSWAMELGYSIAYVAEAEVVHLHEETWRQVYKRYKREAIALKQILPESTFTFGDFLKNWTKFIILDMNQARREQIFFKELLSILTFRWMQYWGTYRGFHYRGEVNAQLHRAFYYPPGILEHKIPKSREVEPISYRDDSSSS